MPDPTDKFLTVSKLSELLLQCQLRHDKLASDVQYLTSSRDSWQQRAEAAESKLVELQTGASRVLKEAKEEAFREGYNSGCRAAHKF